MTSTTTSSAGSTSSLFYLQALDGSADLQSAAPDYGLDQRDDGVVVIEDDADFDLSAGTLTMSVNASDTSSQQGLFSRDARFNNTGGHFSVWIDNGRVFARLQDTSHSYTLSAPIEEGTDTDIAVRFGDDGVSSGFELFIDGVKVDGSDYAGGMAGNDEPVVIGALQWTSGEGTSDSITSVSHATITDVALTDTRLSDADIAAVAEDAGAFYGGETDTSDGNGGDEVGDDAGDGGSDTGETGGTGHTGDGLRDEAVLFLGDLDGADLVQPEGGALTGEEVASNVIVIDNDPAFDLSAGTLTMTVETDDVDARQGLFSRDASFYGGGGHLSVWIEDDEIRVRLQDTSTSYSLRAPIEAGVETDIALRFGDDGTTGGFELFVDGVLVDSSDHTGGIDGNDEPIVIGALQWASSEGTANRIQYHNKGTITDVALTGERLTEAEIAAVADDATAFYLGDAGDGGDTGDTGTVNTAPVAGDDQGFAVETGAEIVIDTAALLANDTDADGDALTITEVDGAELRGSEIVFTAGDTAGPASFSYTVADGQGGSDTGIVSVEVTEPVIQPNTAPVAADDTGFTVETGAELVLDAASLLANDSDADGDALTITAVEGAELRGDQIVFTAGDAAATATIAYTVEDGQGGSDTATVTIDVVEPVSQNNAPMARDDLGFVVEAGETLTIDAAELLANDTDPDGDLLTITAVSGAALQNGQVVFEAGDVEEEVLFTYTVDDGNGGTDTATVSVDVLPASNQGGGGTNAAPVASGATMSMGHGGAPIILDATGEGSDVPGVMVSSTGLLDNVTDADGDRLDVVEISGADNGTVFELPDGNWYYKADDNFSGMEMLTVSVSDGVNPPVEYTHTVHVMPALEHTTHQAPGDEARLAEHLQFLDIAKPSEATHIAVQDGAWSDPATWADGIVPGDEAKVFIPQGMSVDYDIEVGDAPRLDWVRLDGTLDFEPEFDTQMIVDTIVAAPSSTLLIGTEDDPVTGSVDIVFRSDTASIEERDWDPGQFSKGLVAHGTSRVYGEEKAEFVKLDDAMAGDDVLTLREVPENWQVGDRLVLAGTNFDKDGSNEDNTKYQDEVLEITAIDGDEIRFINRSNDAVDGQTTLAYDHARPEGHEERTDIYVANMDRNVTFRSEDGVDTEIEQRGHVMFMHNDDVEVHNAGFEGLGRTDKNEQIDDDGSNVRGRYALHYHKTGDDDLTGKPAEAEGNAVWGSPGWGIVHHDSHLNVTDNVVFDVTGSGIVAEDGTEIGTWENNLVMKTTGHDKGGMGADDLDTTNDDARNRNFDFGFAGEAYWQQGAQQVEMIDNKATSSVFGVNHFRRSDNSTNPEGTREIELRKLGTVAEGGELMVDANGDPLYGPDNQPMVDENGNPRVAVAGEIIPDDLASQYYEQGYGPDDTVSHIATNWKGDTGTEVYNVGTAEATWFNKRSNTADTFHPGHTEDTHRQPDVIQDLEAWNVHNAGVHLQYSSLVEIDNGFLHAAEGSKAAGGDNGSITKDVSYGHALGHNNQGTDLRVEDTYIEGFETGIKVGRPGGTTDNQQLTREGNNTDAKERPTEIRNVTFKDVDEPFAVAGSLHTEVKHTGQPNFSEIEDITNLTPDENSGGMTVGFTYMQVTDEGTLRFTSTSYDWEMDRGDRHGGDGIFAYGWDFDNDGEVDQWGRWAEHDFDVGTHEVGLTVVDASGAEAHTTQTIVVEDEAERHQNMILNGTFEPQAFEYDNHSLMNTIEGAGWAFHQNKWSIDESLGDGGAARSGATTQHHHADLSQHFKDDSVHDGALTLSFDVMNLTAGSETTVRLVGYSGETYRRNGDIQDYALDLSTEYEELVTETITFDGTNTWESFEYTFDVGDGYDHYTLIFDQDGSVAVDNVFMGEADRVIATDDIVRVVDDSTATFDVLSNDRGIGGSELTIVGATSEDGVVTINEDGTLTFEAGDDFKGMGEVDYIVEDATGDRSTATAEVYLDPVSSEDLKLELLMEDGDDGDGVLRTSSPEHFMPALVSETPYEIDGSMYGDARWDEDGGVRGGGTTFEGDGELVVAHHWGDRDRSEDRTMSFWFKTDDLSENQIILDGSSGRNNPDQSTSMYIEDGELHVGLGSTWGGMTWASTDGIEEGKWHHVVLAQDSGRMVTYLDGEKFGDAPASSGLNTIGWSLGNADGAFRTDGEVDDLGGLQGAVDEFRVYDRDLSDAEIQALANENLYA
ncbi:MAG: cadherin-like domain-containing protein [Paracoccaceae bacterium]|nr:cadherin-like domain-containing protein [Paracoccaceae bacterium]